MIKRKIDRYLADFIELSWRKIIFLQDNFKNLTNR